jgi:N utilization substance protein B
VAARSKARKRALDVLFEADQRGLDPLDLLAERLAERQAGSRPAEQVPIPEYAVELVEGVMARRARIDELLSTYAHGWTLDRMPAVDRAVLRLGAWELLYNDDVPDPVAIDEAVELARTLSTAESPAFVNGLLARLLEIKPSVIT